MNNSGEKLPPMNVIAASQTLKEYLKAEEHALNAQKEYNLVLSNTKWPFLYAIAETRVYANGTVKLAETFFCLDKVTAEIELAKRTYPMHTKMFTIEHGTITRLQNPTKEQLTDALSKKLV